MKMSIYDKAALGTFETRKEALTYLNMHPLNCVEWIENGKRMSAIYWNGKRHIQPADEMKRWK